MKPKHPENYQLFSFWNHDDVTRPPRDRADHFRARIYLGPTNKQRSGDVTHSQHAKELILSIR